MYPCLQKKRRSLIVSIDNRAQEISKDIGLNVCCRGDTESISNFIESRIRTSVQVH